jgi:hypothetical protein
VQFLKAPFKIKINELAIFHFLAKNGQNRQKTAKKALMTPFFVDFLASGKMENRRFFGRFSP